MNIKVSHADIQAWTATALFRTVVFVRARLVAGKIRTSNTPQPQFGSCLTIVPETAFVNVRAVAGNSRTFWAGRDGPLTVRGPSNKRRIGNYNKIGTSAQQYLLSHLKV